MKTLGSKECSGCHEVKSLDSFHADKSKKDGRHSRCVACHHLYHKTKRASDPEWRARCLARSAQYRRDNPEKVKAAVRSAQLKKKYGISHEEYVTLLEVQGGVCAICGNNESGVSSSGRLHVDHDHETGRVRGLLCQPCNTGLGKFKDSAIILKKAEEYLSSKRYI